MKWKFVKLLAILGIVVGHFDGVIAAPVAKTDSSAAHLVYRDPKSRITFYVELDGRHVVAINKAGTVLWRRNPFADAHLPPYRVSHTTINVIGPVSDAWLKCCSKRIGKRYISIGFNSTQYGIVDEESGDYVDQGEN